MGEDISYLDRQGAEIPSREYHFQRGAIWVRCGGPGAVPQIFAISAISASEGED